MRVIWSEYAPRTSLDVFEDFYRVDDVSSRGAWVLVQEISINFP